MSNDSNRLMEDKINEEIEQIFNGQTTITKERMKQALEDFRMGGHGRGGGGIGRSSPIHDEMKQKISQLLEAELNKINSNTITKEQAKSALLSFSNQAKEQWHAQIDKHIQSSIKDELNKLSVHEVNANQARDILRNIMQKISPSSSCESPTLNDNMKNEFMNEFKTKHGTNKINADETWEIIKSFDKKQHDKIGSCERNINTEKEKEKKMDEIFNEQYKELLGDVNKKINQQQLEDLAKKMKEKFRQECPKQCSKQCSQQCSQQCSKQPSQQCSQQCSQQPGKRFCQH